MIYFFVSAFCHHDFEEIVYEQADVTKNILLQVTFFLYYYTCILTLSLPLSLFIQRPDYEISFERVHRMGNYNELNDRPRNIVAKFTFLKDRTDNNLLS